VAGDEETRAPVIRNPNEYGAFCKHTQLVFDQLPFYTNDLSKHVAKFYANELDKAEEQGRVETAKAKAGAEVLRKKEEEQ
jgi:hypothetical protein